MSGGESGRLISSELLFQRVRRYGSVVCMGTYREETPGAGTKGARMNRLRRAHGTNGDIKSLLPPGTGCYRYLPWSRATQPEYVNLPFDPSSSVPPSLFLLPHVVHVCKNSTTCFARVGTYISYDASVNARRARDPCRPRALIGVSHRAIHTHKWYGMRHGWLTW